MAKLVQQTLFGEVNFIDIMGKYSWSFDGDAEIWYESANSIEQCIAEAKASIESGESAPVDTVYIGENCEFIPTVVAESILEQIEDDAFEFAGEIGGDWNAYDYKSMKLELEELSATLSEDVRAWLKKHGREPNFCAVQNVKGFPLNR